MLEKRINMKNLIKESIYWIFVACFLVVAISSYLFVVSLLLISDILFVPLCFLFGLFRWTLTSRESLLTSIKKEFEILYDLNNMIITMPFRSKYGI